MPELNEKAVERLMEYGSCSDCVEPCWPWTGPLGGGGYGRLNTSGRGYVMAHRAMYEHLIGPISKGMQIDHLCRSRACVNPFHMEVVDNKTNVLRGNGVTAQNARKTKCLRGHPLDYVRPSSKGRTCRICRNASTRKSKQRKRRKTA